MLTTGSHMNRMTSWRPESAYVFTESFVDPSRAALHKDNTHTKHKKKQKNTRALNHTTMPPLFYTQEILHRFHWTHFSLNFLPQTFIRRTCLILWLLCTSWLMLQSFMKLYVIYVLPLGREWSEQSGFFALHALHNLTLHAWRCTLCARSLYGTPGSCENPGSWAHAIFDHVFHVESHVNKICRSNDMAHPTNNFAKSCNPTADTHRLTTTASLSDASMEHNGRFASVF